MDPTSIDAMLKDYEHDELSAKLLDNIWQNEFTNLFTFLMVLAN
jgi:hypothetical protein